MANSLRNLTLRTVKLYFSVTISIIYIFTNSLYAFTNSNSSNSSNNMLEDTEEILNLPKYPKAIISKESNFELNKYFEMIANGNAAEAEENIKKYLEKYKDIAEVHYNLGLATAFIGKYDEAITHLNNSIKLKPNFIEPYIALSTICITLKKIDEAIKILDIALDYNPDINNKMTILYNKGVSLLKKKLFFEAEVCFAEVLAYNPSDYDSLYKLAVSNYLQSKYSESLDLLNTIEKYLPLEVSFLKCKIFSKLNKLDQALTEVRKIKDIINNSLENNTKKEVVEKILSEIENIINEK